MVVMDVTNMAEGLRERKKRATRAALQLSAVTLCRQRGPAAVTVEDICADAGVSPRTFFNYFATKEEAVFSLDDGIPDLIAAMITERPADEGPLEAIRAVFTARLEDLARSDTWRERTLLLREHPELLPKIAQPNQSLENAVAAAVAARTHRSEDDLAVRTVAAVAFAASRVAICYWRPGSEPSLATLMNQTLDSVRDGLRV